MSEYVEKIVCPKCNSSMIECNKKGFGLGKAAVGAIATGGIGLLAGFIGSNKIKATCLSCGKIFDPKDGYVKEKIHSEPVVQKKSDKKEESIIPKFSNNIEIHLLEKKYNTVINMSDEEVEKKFQMWDNLRQKGLISEAELNKRKKEYFYIRKK